MSIIINNLVLSGIYEIERCADQSIIKNTKLHINAAEEVNTKILTPSIVQINLNWYDGPLQDINENGILFQLIKMIDTYINCGKQVLVNCFAGVSRSTTIVVAYLMYKNKWGVQDAVSFVRSKRPFVNPNYGFISQLYNLQDKLYNLDENFNEYCSEFENKTSSQLAQEVSTTSSIPFIQEIIKREMKGYDIPSNMNNPFL